MHVNLLSVYLCQETKSCSKRLKATTFESQIHVNFIVHPVFFCRTAVLDFQEDQ